MGVGSGEQGGRVPPWIFIHGTNVVDKGLKVLFFGVFYYFSVFFPLPPLPGRGLIVLFFSLFWYFRSFFPLTPPGNFSARRSCLGLHVIGKAI